MSAPVSVFSAFPVRQKYADMEDSLGNVSVCLSRTHHSVGERCMRKLAGPWRHGQLFLNWEMLEAFPSSYLTGTLRIGTVSPVDSCSGLPYGSLLRALLRIPAYN